MIYNAMLGSIVVSATVLIQVFGLKFLSVLTETYICGPKLSKKRPLQAMVFLVHGLFVLIFLQIFLWALVYHNLGVLSSFGDALYFSGITFSTVGYGDIYPEPGWRILAAIESVDGFLVIGWATAYLVSAAVRYGPFEPDRDF